MDRGLVLGVVQRAESTLQEDLNAIEGWLETWQMLNNAKLCIWLIKPFRDNTH